MPGSPITIGTLFMSALITRHSLPFRFLFYFRCSFLNSRACTLNLTFLKKIGLFLSLSFSLSSRNAWEKTLIWRDGKKIGKASYLREKKIHSGKGQRCGAFGVWGRGLFFSWGKADEEWVGMLLRLHGTSGMLSFIPSLFLLKTYSSIFFSGEIILFRCKIVFF